MPPEVVHPDVASEDPSDRDRRYWQIQKLRAQTRQLQRPVLLSPATLIALVTAIVAVIGALDQYRRNQELMQLEVLRTEVARYERAKLEETKAALQAEIDTMMAQNRQMTERLESVRQELARAEQQLQAAAAGSGATQALSQVRRYAATLGRAASDSERAQEQQAERLDAIRTRLTASPAAVRKLTER